MTLSDLVSDLFIYLVVFRRKLASGLPLSAESVANDLEMIFARMDRKASEDVGLTARYDSVRKILAIVADGLVMGSEWDAAFDYRSDHLLENKFYQSNEGGELFYDWMKNLPGEDAEAREIGFTALALGFQGRYAQQPEVRTEMKRKLYNSLPQRVLDSSEKLTPQAYEHTDERDCTVPPVVPMVRYLIVLVGLLIFFLVLGQLLYNDQKSYIESRVPPLTNG